MSAARLLPVRGRDGRYSGDLPPEAAREIADRLRAGEGYDAISEAVGMGRRIGRRKCAEVAKVLGLEIERSRYEIDTDEVLRRVNEGQDDHEIAAALDRSVGSVATIRRKHGFRYFTQLRFSDEENAEIERRLIAGETTRAVAAAVGCDQGDVQRRRRRIAHLIVKDLPPCACGKANNHGGRCNLIVDPQVVRDRLLAGKTASEIAREFDRTAQSFKPKYVDPVIADLTREGHRCACGRPLGHQVGCAVTLAAQRRAFTDAERDRATTLVRAGLSVAKIRADLGINLYGANMLVDEVRHALAAQGVRCPCGDPIDHSMSCTARNGSAKGRTAFRFSSAAALSMTQDARRIASKMARQGWPLVNIIRSTGETEWKVAQLVDELGAAGHLPSKCRNCDQPYRHRRICPKPKLCKCGRPRKHRGACRRGDRRKNVPFTKLAPERVAEVKRRYRDRESMRSISRTTGVSFRTVQRLVTHWRAKSKYDPAPCLCGRPLRHGGTCWANRSGVAGKRHLTRIEAGLRAGTPARVMSEQLKLSVMTIMKHAVPIRDRLFAEGITCACGRPLNHNFWCSARWDAHELPRGRRPFPKAKEALAIDALLRGDLVAEVAKAVGASASSVWRLRATLSDEHRAQRALAMRARLKIERGRQGELLMDRIKAVMPRGLDAVLRDDVVGEIYLAVIEGRVEPEQIGAVARSFVNRGLREWQPFYGPRSLDAAIGADGSRTLADLVGDETTADAIGEIEIGQPSP